VQSLHVRDLLFCTNGVTAFPWSVLMHKIGIIFRTDPGTTRLIAKKIARLADVAVPAEAKELV
jgi:hypothetical protein